MSMAEEQTSLEVKIARVETKVDYLLTAMKDLKDNFAKRLDAVEMSKFPSTDFIQFRNNDYVPLKDTVEKLVEFKTTIKGGMIALGIFAPIVSALITAWLTSKLIH